MHKGYSNKVNQRGNHTSQKTQNEARKIKISKRHKETSISEKVVPDKHQQRCTGYNDQQFREFILNEAKQLAQKTMQRVIEKGLRGEDSCKTHIVLLYHFRKNKRNKIEFC